MTQDCRKPKTGSSIYNALQMMYDAGGSATFAELRSTLAASNSSMSQLYMRVVDPMVSRGMAMLGDDCLRLLQPGYSFVRSTRGEEAAPDPAQIVPPRYVPPMREMQPCQIGVSHRAGADEYRKWPSLMGDRRVPHG
jgi:hypothetical protein